MAAIGSLRRRGKVVSGILGGMLVIFIASSGLNGSLGSGPDLEAGSVMGEEIDINKYNEAVREEERIRVGLNKGKNLTEAERDELERNIWNRLTISAVLGQQREKLGISVTEDEIKDVNAIAPDQVLQRSFTNPETGQFDKASFFSFVDGIEENTPEMQAQWYEIKRYLNEKMLSTKYTDFLTKGMYAPTWEAENFYNNRFRKVTAKYVMLPYSDITEEIEVTDNEIQKYLMNHAAEYQNDEPSRKMEYVGFVEVPSSSDSMSYFSKLAEIKEDFRSTEDDSLFVAINSDFGYSGIFQVEDEIEGKYSDVVMNSAEGTVFGPYYEGDAVKMLKVVSKKKIADSIKLNTIVIAPKSQDDTYETLQTLTDSIADAVKGGASFAALAKKYSADKASGEKGGEFGWIQKNQAFGMLPYHVASKAFGGVSKSGDIETGFNNRSQAFFIYQIEKVKHTTPAVQLALISNELMSSSYTGDSVFNEASKFYSLAREKGFETAANELGLDIRTPRELTPSTKNIPGLGDASSMVTWTFTNNEGDLSSVKQVGNTYLVAKLTEVREKGLMSLSQIKDQIKAKIIKERKGDLLVAKYKEALAASTLEDIAAKSGKTVGTLTEITFENPFDRGEVGRDFKVAGACFGLKEKELSKPIYGNNGVVVVAPEFFLDAAQMEDLDEYKDKVKSAHQSRANFSINKAVVKHANIEDKRYKFNN